MVLPASDLIDHPIPYPEDQETYGIYNKMAAAAAADSEYLVIHEQAVPNINYMLVNKEKQISVDPISLKESSHPHPNIISLPKITPTLLLPAAKPKFFLSSSLPSSATSSPRFSSSSNLLLKRKYWKNQKQASSSLSLTLTRQHSAVLSQLAKRQESHLQRSKSCGEGRASAPPDDFDLWFSKINNNNNNNPIGHDQRRHFSSFSNIETSKMEEEIKINTSGRMVDPNDNDNDEKFKCGALCLFLPGFGKGKPVRPRRKDEEAEMMMGHVVVSRTVSLEKFECGSWTSSAIMNDINDEEDQDGDSANNLFFDLPLELIRSSVNDAHSPIKAAFVFDKDVKGVLKNGGGGGGGTSSTSRATTGCSKSHESSSRHVRFSTSSPMSHPTSPSASCITPRLRKAREDFNAFLEAQSA